MKKLINDIILLFYMVYKKKNRGYSGELMPLDDDFELLAPTKPDDYYTGEDERFFSQYVSPVVMNRDENRCVKCGATENLLIHHNSYDDDISIYDMATLCKHCHQRLHRHREPDELQTDLF